MTSLNIRSLITPLTILCLLLFNSFSIIDSTLAESGFEFSNLLEQRQTLTGTIRLFNVDAFSKDGKSIVYYKILLFTDEGNVIELEFAPSLNLPHSRHLPFEGQYITVEGEFKSSEARTFIVNELQVKTTFKEPLQSKKANSFPWLSVLCTYPDRSDSIPSKSHFERLLIDYDYPSVDHCIREISYNRANFQGSQIVGPYTLSMPYGRYNFDSPNDDDSFDQFQMEIFLGDIMSQVKNDVDDISSFYGIFFIMNADPALNLGPGIVGSFMTSAIIDSQSYSIGVYGPTHGWNHQAIFVHESIHSFGVKHSCHPDSFTVIPNWDIMGGGGSCNTPHPEFGCLAIHTIAWHKLLAGWIDPGQNFHLDKNTSGIIKLERLEFPSFDTGNYLMAEITSDVMPETQFYTVEYRYQLGYDAAGAIPGNGVIIHHIDKNRKDNFGTLDFFAQIVDDDNNGNPNDNGAIWTPGETFLPGANIMIHIESMDEERAVISLSNKILDPVYANVAYDGPEDGTIGAPWNTVAEAYASVIPSGTVIIQPGIYREIFKLTKPCKLKNYRSDMSVFIGNNGNK